MSSLIHIPKNGKLENKSGLTHNVWSNWIDDLFPTNYFAPQLASRLDASVDLPKVNIKETKDGYFVYVAVPGFDKSDFKIDLENKSLVIALENAEEAVKEEENYTRKEFNFKGFKRTFSLPDTVDESKIEATYRRGILTVQLPKREEAKEKPPRTIEIS